MSTSELKHCPFCGSRPIDFNDNGRHGQIVCSNCDASTPVCVNVYQAIEIWQRRAILHPSTMREMPTSMKDLLTFAPSECCNDMLAWLKLSPTALIDMILFLDRQQKGDAIR